MKYLSLKVLWLFCLLVPLQMSAQEIVLQGVVSDVAGPLPGASVFIQNSEERVFNGVVTNVNGEYLLRIPSTIKDEGLSVVFSFIGYKTKTIKYTNQKKLDVSLEEESTTLAQVEVVGEAIERNNMGIDEKILGVARQKIDMEEFEDMAVSSVEDILQGKLANVDVMMTSGDPGAGSSFRIRGTGSLNANNEPLIVIDEIPQSIKINDDFDFATADQEDFGTLVNINPNDIQSIEVLKDAAATTLWGSKAANGVLLITTKRGGNHKPRFTVSEKLNVSFEPKGIPMLNGKEYVTLMQDALWNYAKDNAFSEQSMSLLTKYPDILYDPTYIYFDEFNANTDWLDLIVNDPVSSQTDFSMSGGGDRASYRFSLGYSTENGTTEGTRFNRISSRLNYDFRFSNKLTVNTSFSYSEGNKDAPFKDPRGVSLKKMPNMSPWLLDENGRSTGEYFVQPMNCIQGRQDNPLALAYDSKNNTIQRAMGMSVNAGYRIGSHIRLSAVVSFNMNTSKNDKFLPANVADNKWSDSQYNQSTEALTNSTSSYVKLQFNWNRTFKSGHSISLGLNGNINASSNNNYSATTSGNAAEELADPSSGGKITSLNSAMNRNRTVNIAGTVAYNYKDRYSLATGGGLNANSNTGKADRWKKPRPSLSATWRVTNERFMKPVFWLNELRVRASWAKSENTPSTSTTAGTFASENFYMDMPAIKPNQMQLNNLKPEVNVSYNIGLDATLWRNKITLGAEYYRRTTEDLLQNNMKIPSSTGYPTIRYFNSGKMRNEGWEFMISLRDVVDKRGWKLSFNNMNISRNKNQVLELPITMEAQKFKIKNGEYAHRVIEGHPCGAFYGFDCLGVYQNLQETVALDDLGNPIYDIDGNSVITTINDKIQRPGDAKYADVNKDGIINQYDIIYLGNSNPHITGGFSVSLQYKNLSLRSSFHFRIGQSVINAARWSSEGMSTADNHSKAVLGRWRHEGDNTMIPRALWGDNYNSLGSNRFVEDASFLKCKDITLNYRLSKDLLKKIHLSSASVYFTTYNIFTVTDYLGQDPEVGGGGGAYGLAKDNALTPRARKVALGVSLSF